VAEPPPEIDAKFDGTRDTGPLPDSRVSEEKDDPTTPLTHKQRPREHADDHIVDETKGGGDDRLEDFAPIGRTNTPASILKQTSPPSELSESFALESRVTHDSNFEEHEPALMTLEPLAEHELRELLILLTDGSSEEEAVEQQHFSENSHQGGSDH
jgi:hypothetical protein